MSPSILCPYPIEDWFIDDDGRYRIAFVRGKIHAGSRPATPREVYCINKERGIETKKDNGDDEED